MEFGKHYFQMSMIKVACYEMHCLWMSVLLKANGVVQLTEGGVSICIRCYVNNRNHDNSKLPWKILGPAFDGQILQVRGAMAIDGSDFGAPIVVHINA